MIRVFDEQIHQRVDIPGEQAATIDQRWVRIRRPLVIVGGELTLEMLDLIYSPTLRCYEAPPHLKANGGVFLVDDFGRERVSPEQLLNRFITPMEHQIDYFTLRTGQKIQLPLRHVLIIATNLSPERGHGPGLPAAHGLSALPGTAHAGTVRAEFSSSTPSARGGRRRPELIERLLERYRAQNRRAARVRAARPDRACPRHLPLPRRTVGVDPRGAGPGLDWLFRQRAGGEKIEWKRRQRGRRKSAGRAATNVIRPSGETGKPLSEAFFGCPCPRL